MSKHLDHIQNIHALFETYFMEAYRAANPRKRRNTLPYLQSIYRRWYYSTLIENTPLSPANLVETIRMHYNQPAVHPVAHPQSTTKMTGITMTLPVYTLDKHPIIDDLHILVEYCSPHIDLRESDAFDTSQALELAAKTSLNDPHYAAFLLEIAIWMGLIKKIPSVGINRFQISKTADKALSAPCPDILREIVDITVVIASKALQNLVMLPESIFSQQFVRSLLTNPMGTDDIFSRIYEVLGYDLDDVFDMAMDVEDDEDAEDAGMDIDILAGTFMTGVFLDKFFFTPFGHFMKIIHPMYVLPFEFTNEIPDYARVSDDAEESLIAFFAPCSAYTLTDLGLELLGVAKTDTNYIDAAAAIPFEQMKNSVFSCKEALQVFVEIGRHIGALQMDGLPLEDEEIYTFRVRFESDTSLWAHIQVPADANLHDMYVEIAACFDLKDNEDYAFFHDKTENRFREYASPKRHKRGKKRVDVEFGSLDFEVQKNMLMVAYNQAIPFGGQEPTVRLELELMHIKPAEEDYEYPRVSRVSAGMKLY